MAVTQNKHLTFILANETYGIPILKVKEIIGRMTITHVPQMPYFVRGVINLRGKIIPVVDLRIKLGMAERDYDDRTCFIVTEIQTATETKLVGLIVDMVSEVLEVPQSSIELPPACESKTEGAFLTGIGKVKDKVILLIDPNSIMNEWDKDILGLVAEETGQDQI